MNGKHKRKKEHQKGTPHFDIAIPKSAVPQEQLRTDTAKNPAAQRSAERQSGPKSSMKVVWGKSESVLPWATFLAAVVVAVIYFLQLQVMQQTVRIDQRPWIKISMQPM